MRSIRKSGVVALTAAIALSIGAIPVAVTLPALVAGGEATISPAGPLTSSGFLSIETGVNDRVQLDVDGNLATPPERTQSLTPASKCALGTDGSILDFKGFIGTSTTNKVSFGSDSVGVADKTNGQSCIQVGAPSERLQLKLNATNVRDDFGPLVASSAYLDLELKQSARILATAGRAGYPNTYFELQSGSTVGTTTPLPGGVTAKTSRCNGSADSGPDSGIGDNCRWAISVPSWQGPDDNVYFDTLTLQALNGSFSLEGGSDGLVPSPPLSTFPQRASLIELSSEADGILDCGEERELNGAPGDALTKVTVTRVENAQPEQVCARIPYRFTKGANETEFLKPLASQTSAQFTFDFEWTAPANANWEARSPLVPPTNVDFDGDAGNAPVDLAWCPDLVESTTFAGFLVVEDVKNNPRAVDQAKDFPAADDTKQFACIVSQQPTLNADESLTVRERVFVYGDVKFARP